MPKLRVKLGIGISNARRTGILDIDEDEWNACANEEEREKLMDEYANEWADNYIDIGCELIE